MRKKILFLFSLLLFSAVSQAQQDTIVLINGQKIKAKVSAVTYDVFYYVPPDTEQHSVDKDQVNYIGYKDGSVHVISHPDTTGFKPKFYFTVSGQYTLPAFNSYAYINEYNLYEGYAQPGISYSVSGGVNLYHGWGVVAMYSYIPINYDASYFINEASGIPFPSSVTIGSNCHFTNYAYMLGITNASNSKYGDIGFRAMAGSYVTYIPAMQSTSGNWGFNNPNAIMYSLYTTSAPQTNLVLDLGFYGDIKIMKHILLHTAVDVLLSKMTVNGNYRVVDASTGNTAGSGSYSNSGILGVHRADLINIGAGLGYLF